MDIRIKQIISKSAGTYFLVTDNSQVQEIESESKLRLFFINSEKGTPNTLFKFSKNNIAGFTQIFGKGSRSQEKKGNFSHSVCIDALASGPIAVINLRKFEDVDTAGICGLNPNTKFIEELTTKYTNLFNTNSFWSINPEGIKTDFTEENFLNFANVGNNDISIFVVKSKNYTELIPIEEANKSLANCSLEIDEYPALDFNMLLKDTFVDVYVFNNTFNSASNTNQYYGQFFNVSGNLDLTRIDEFKAIKESGFVDRVTGSLIPGLLYGENQISIDDVVNANYLKTGLTCNINDSIFETATTNFIDVYGYDFFDVNDALKLNISELMLSHVLPANLTTTTNVYPMTLANQNVPPTNANKINYFCEKVNSTQFIGSFEQGIKINDKLIGEDGVTIVEIIAIEIINAAAVIGATSDTYTKVKYTASGNLRYLHVNALTGPPIVPATDKVTKIISFSDIGLIKPFNLSAYIPRSAQFTDGTAARQTEILDMMNDAGIVKGCRTITGLRYVVDCFKSYVESGYKNQYGKLMVSLDESNKFVRAILNEIFVEDLEKSTNPLFKSNPSQSFDWEYVPLGGNINYSTRLLNKFTVGSFMCFFFGPGNVVKSITKPITGLISNIFYTKTYPFDIVANSTGYVDGITELEANIDDIERASCEKFRYNPIINFNGGNTIYGNLTGQKEVTSLQQTHNSELLAYIKESLYTLAKGEAFKKATYDDYLRTETESLNFMKSLVLKNAIQGEDLVVVCNATNNTLELQKNKVKLIHIEYRAIDGLEKIVFDLNIK